MDEKHLRFFFFDSQWHDLGFFAKISIILGFFGGNYLSRSWQEIQDVQDLGKKFKIIQDCPRSWQENEDGRHWEEELLYTRR